MSSLGHRLQGGSGYRLTRLKTDEEIPAGGLVVGEEVLLMTLAGRAVAHITDIESPGDAYAEDEFNIYPLRVEDAYWICDSAWNKRAVKKILRGQPG